MYPPEEWSPQWPEDKGAYEEARSTYLDLAFGVELKVDAVVRGWSKPAKLAADPDDSHDAEGEEEVEVTDVTLLAFGKTVDLTDLYKMKTDPDLLLAVEEAIEIIN